MASLKWWIGRALGWRWPSSVRFKNVTYIASRTALPAALSEDEFIVVGAASRPKWAIFECPCRRGHRIEIPLDSKWRLSRHRGRPTLVPSIHLDGSWHCHFVVTQGAIHWVDRRYRT